MPRLTNAQMLAISSPATGDLVWNTTYTNYYYYNGSIWTLLCGQGWSLTGDLGTNASTNFLGTKDATDLIQKTNVRERFRVYSGGDVGLINTLNQAEELRLFEPSSSGALFTGFKAGAQAGNVHYILPLADGTANQALVTDGSGNLSWHTFSTFGGSGSQSLWKRGSATGGEYSDSSGNSSSGPYSLSAGKGNSVTGNYEVVFGGNNQGVSGSYGTVHGGGSNASSGDLDVVFGGFKNSASATGSTIGGGYNNATSGNDEVVLGGQGGSFSGTNSTIIGGYNCKVSSNNELIYGYSTTIGGGSGFVVFKIGTHTKFGINTDAPTEALDVVGNVKFSAALKPNGTAGTSGQYLKSAGSGVPPTWGTISIPSTNWGLSGTFGSAPATNFLGTTDAQDIVVKTASIERARITSSGIVAINTSTASAFQFNSVLSATTNETSAVFAAASGATTNQAIGLWGDVDNTTSSNTGTIAVLATGNGNTAAGTTNVALQVSQGEFAVGRTTQTPSKGNAVEGATSHTAWSAQGPSGVIELSLGTDLIATPPTTGVFQDLGTVTINNRYITSSSIILAGVVAKNNGGGLPDPKNSVYKVDVESRTAGSCVLRIGMLPFVTDPSNYQGSDNIRVGYAVINPSK